MTNKKMNKVDVASALRLQHPELSKSQAAGMVDDVLGILSSFLENDLSVTLSGFGSFKNIKVDKGQARNPKTGQWVQVAPHRRIVFRLSPSIRNYCK